MPELPKTFTNLQMPPINHNSKVSFVEITLLALIMVLFYWFVISPKRTELADLNVKLDGLKGEFSKIEGQKKELERSIDAMNANRDKIAKLDEALPLEGKLTVINLLVEKLAEEAGITLDNVSFSLNADNIAAGNKELLKSPHASARSLKKIIGNLNIRGDLGQIQNFLQKLETSGRIYDISNFQVTADQNNQLALSLGISSYYFAP